MAEQDIIQNMITRLGQSQADRSPPELEVHYADIDERTPAELLAQARALAQWLNYYRDTPDTVAGNWSSLFPADDAPQDLLGHRDGQLPPHLGLLAGFLRLYDYPRRVINTLTARHMDFQLSQVLGFQHKPAQPDRVHLLFELKKGVAKLAITPAHRFSAGKDASGMERIYQPVRETVIGHGKVAALQSVSVSAKGVCCALVANSADGLGGALDAAAPKWRPFGGQDQPHASIGFAVASPLLRLQEGTRQVRLNLQLGGLDPAVHSEQALSACFEAWLSGPKGWLGPFSANAKLTGNWLTLSIDLPDTAPAVVDYDAAVHGPSFTAQGPVLQVLCKRNPQLGYGGLAKLSLTKTKLAVTVSGLTSLTLENDGGSLNPKKAFLPFGAQPVRGSQFYIGCEEALSKRLTGLQLQLVWQGAPDKLDVWYKDYKATPASTGMKANRANARLAYRDRSGQIKTGGWNLMERKGGVAHYPNDMPPQGEAQPISPREGFITISLEDEFLHAAYRQETVANVVNHKYWDSNPVTVLNEPYTPKAQSLSLAYQAESEEVDLGFNDATSFAGLDVQFFHVGCFGQRREHAYLRALSAQKTTAPDSLPNGPTPGDGSRQPLDLLPVYAEGGVFYDEFLIGLSGVTGGDSVSLLAQVAEGSANPDLAPQTLAWSVLCGNAWRTLSPREISLDTSNDLRTSGLWVFALPQAASTEHTWMAPGLVWLRARVPSGLIDPVCRLAAVAANAVEARFLDQGNDPAHLALPLAAGSIARLLPPLATVQSVSQPYASFGGSRRESDGQLHRRAAERLRHHQRCVTPWDYERLLLEAFPHVHKIKCIPHASADSWLAPGHLLLVAIPDLRNCNAVDPLQPRVDTDTLARLAEFARAHAGLNAQLAADRALRVTAKNPRYRPVRLEFKVRMKPGLAFNDYLGPLQQVLLQALSPWAYDAAKSIEFGGGLYRSALLALVEKQKYVDFVTDFKMGLVPEGNQAFQDTREIRADTPDAILTSCAGHAITAV